MNCYLSHTYSLWYSRLLRSLKLPTVYDGISHPHQLLTKKNKAATFPRFKISLTTNLYKSEPENDELITNSQLLYDFLRLHKMYKNLNDVMQVLPNVTNNRTFSGCSKTKPKLLIIDKDNAFVVVGVGTDTKYIRNYYLLKDIFNKNPSVIENIGLLKSKDCYYFLSEYKGFDYETLILDFQRNDLEEELLDVCRRVEYLSKNIFFLRNNAPRNIITNSSGLKYIIDFDNVYKLGSTSQTKLYIKSLEKYVWYADIFDFNVTEKLFNKIDAPKPNLAFVKTGDFEKMFYKTDRTTISLEDYAYTFQLTKKLEHRDIIDGKKVFGHELGRFISDCWSLPNEVRLLQFIIDLGDELLRILRFNLFVLSRLDQELLFRQSYGVDMSKKLLSECYFEKIDNKINSITMMQVGSGELMDRYDFNDLYERCTLFLSSATVGNNKVRI